MELNSKIAKACRIVESLAGRDLEVLQSICSEIALAQQILNHEAEAYFKACTIVCRGICCRNINVNDVVTQLDLIYILGFRKELAARLFKCAESETLYTADCPFLKNHVGPCVLPTHQKPERCVLTFCSDTRPIRREIKAVRSGFTKLSRHIKIKRPFLWIGF